MNTLVYILRLKQCCDSPMLVIKTMKRLAELYKNNQTNDNDSPNNSHDNSHENNNPTNETADAVRAATKLLEFYNTSQRTKQDCPICYDNEADVIANCGHKCCKECWDKLLDMSILDCPTCRTKITLLKSIYTQETYDVLQKEMEDIRVAERDIRELESDIRVTESDITSNTSSKIKSLISILKQKLKLGEKVVVVSQWVGMLDIVKENVEKALPDIKSISLKGKIKPHDRQTLIEEFQMDQTIKICYLSLMSSAEGINLTSANNLVLLDSWWNNSKMSQVFDRIHRIGQTKQVNIYQLTTADSIETKINCLVNKKTKLAELLTSKWQGAQEDNQDDQEQAYAWIKDKIRLISTE
jgi:SNF2 family DNA or RNA helicase